MFDDMMKLFVLSSLMVLFFFDLFVLKIVILSLNVLLNFMVMWFSLLSLMILSDFLGWFMLCCIIGVYMVILVYSSGVVFVKG